MDQPRRGVGLRHGLERCDYRVVAEGRRSLWKKVLSEEHTAPLACEWELVLWQLHPKGDTHHWAKNSAGAHGHRIHHALGADCVHVGGIVEFSLFKSLLRKPHIVGLLIMPKWWVW